MINPLVSLIIYCDEEDGIKKSVELINNFSPSVKGKTEVILINPFEPAEETRITEDDLSGLCAVGVKYILKPGITKAKAYNLAMEYINGEYVLFALSSMHFVIDSIESAYMHLSDYKVKLLSLSPWTVNEKGETIQYIMSPVSNETEALVINLESEPSKLQLFLHAFFIRTDIIKIEHFNENIHDDAALEFVSKLLTEHMEYVYLPYARVYYTHQLEDNISAFMNQHYSWWYKDSFNDWILPFAIKWSGNGEPLKMCAKSIILYLVYCRYICNSNDNNKGVLQGNELDEFFNLTGKILSFLDNKSIYSKRTLQNINIPRLIKVFLLRTKASYNGFDLEPIIDDNRLYLWTHEKGSDWAENFFVSRDKGPVATFTGSFEDDALLPVCELRKEHVILNVVNYNKKSLRFEGNLSIGHYLQRDCVKLFLITNKGESIEADFIDIYDLRKLFGKTFTREIKFSVELPVKSREANGEYSFAILLNGEMIPIGIRGAGSYSRVSEKIKNQYFCFNKNQVLRIKDSGKLLINTLSKDELKSMEENFQKSLLEIGTDDAKRAVEIRRQYFDTLSKYKGKHIWITFDKLYKAGDNGEYIAKYISKKSSFVDIYYIIKEESPDYERLRAEGVKLLVWGSDEALLMALRSEVVLDTHANAFSYMGFSPEMRPYFTDLFTPRIACIQHGLTVQNIAQYQNRWTDNTSLYLCASPNEIRNLNREIYGFNDKSRLMLTGLARYDGLKSNDKRQILISPTWRRSVAHIDVAHNIKGHNDYFKNSTYFKKYNSLINDKRLIEAAGKYNYKIVYLLHPAASSQVDDFDKNEFVDIIPAAGNMNYEKMLTESSLLVTDYSGIQFDFAYMKKPLLYYHPHELPPHYDESEAYRYERDAFGPLIDGHEELVEQLCEYMKNDCEMQPLYKERVDSFFGFNDFNNCKRIYRCIKRNI